MHTKLVIDAGNTRIKLGVFINSELQEIHVFTEVASLSRKLAEFPETSKVMLTNVGAWEIHSAVARFVKSLWLTTHTPLPFKMAYQTPETLGNDRRALTAAAMAEFPAKNVLVIDMGTCVTYDFLDAQNTYHGGAIAPGLNMRLRSLKHFTANLPLVSYQAGMPVDLVGDSTTKAILSGAVLGLKAEVEKIIEWYKLRFDDLQVVLTGGDHLLLADLTKNGIFARPNFLLTGLHYILENNA